LLRLLPPPLPACWRCTSRFLTSACALSSRLSASISGGRASVVFSTSSDVTACAIAIAAAVI
jgi:hypothetical protein